MSTYLEIQNRINLDYLNRTDLNNETKRAILASVRFYEREHFWFNETATSLVASAGQKFVNLPANFLILNDLRITLNSEDVALVRRTPQYIREANTANAQGQPTDYAMYQDRFELAIIPNSAYSLPVYYIHSLPVLSADSDSIAWTNQVEDLIVYRATKLVIAMTLGNPTKAAVFAALERETLQEVQSMNAQRMLDKIQPTRF